MDLYDFIKNDLPNLSKGSFTTEREVLIERVAVPDNDLADLKKERDDLWAKLQAVVIDKESLSGKITSLENHAATLKVERDDLEMQLQAMSAKKDNDLREADRLLKVKASEIEQLKMDITALRRELSETLAGMDHVETEKRASLHELERVRQNLSVYMLKTKTVTVIACIMLIALVAGFLFYYTKNGTVEQKPAGHSVSADNHTEAVDAGRSPQGIGFSASSPQGTIKGLVSARWPGRPLALYIGNFRVSVIPLKSGTVNRLPAALRHEETETHYFYIVKVRAARGNLSPDFLKSPSIDFIGIDNASAVQTAAGSVLRVVHSSMSRRRHTNRGTVLLRCLVSLRKDFRPVGIIIWHLNKETLRIEIV